MSEIVLFTGGARSGKSSMAEKRAARRGDAVFYIATAEIFDEEMEERVRKHRAQRPAQWRTWEGFWDFETLARDLDFVQCSTVLLDCMGYMLNNIMFRLVSDWESCSLEEMAAVEERMLLELKTLMGLCRSRGKDLILVTNEVGMGLVPAERSSRYYRDILGRANAAAAAEADRVCLMVSGLPLEIKG